MNRMSPLGLKRRTVVTAFCLTATLIAATGLDPVIAQEPRNKIVTVSGRGVVSIPTTQTLVRLGVEVQGKNAQEVQQEVAARSEVVMNLLKSRKVEKLQTTGISLNPTYSYQNNVQTLTGYIGNNSVSFRLKTQEAGSLLDDAVKAGATRIEGVSFVASDEDIAKAQQQALINATKEAQKQADTVLNSLNLKSKEVVNISINSMNTPVPQPLLFRSGNIAEAKAPSVTPVVGGEQEVEASVTLQISY